MTRNQLIAEVGRFIDNLKLAPPYPPDPALLGEAERLANDLCNVPSRRNRELGAVTYTVQSGRRAFIGLIRRAK